MPIAAILFSVTATAATSDADIAKDVANEFFANKNFQSDNRLGIKSVKPDVQLAMTPSHEEFFIFNSDSENRFVIVGGEETGFSILGYSDAETFDPDKIPPQKQWLFDRYSQEIRQYRSRRHSPETKTAETATLIPVAPLLGRIAWDQNAPYNLFCPFYIGNYRAATGCAATAMAQIMRYHKYPETGHGTHSYTPTWYEGIGTLTVDYSQSHYDWELMKEQYATDTDPESPEAIAVASFMRDSESP
ncbi:MAG: C10 family peptidase [Duncaniella sp.]|nr:C10 family peptidase [Duncaniella sp.]